MTTRSSSRGLCTWPPPGWRHSSEGWSCSSTPRRPARCATPCAAAAAAAAAAMAAAACGGRAFYPRASARGSWAFQTRLSSRDCSSRGARPVNPSPCPPVPLLRPSSQHVRIAACACTTLTRGRSACRACGGTHGARVVLPDFEVRAGAGRAHRQFLWPDWQRSLPTGDRSRGGAPRGGHVRRPCPRGGWL